MSKSKYWQKKTDGYFFSPCPKDDQNPDVQDGRFLREWNFGKESGTTLGYRCTQLLGDIESAFVSEMPDGALFFGIGLQLNGEVDVFQVEIGSSDTLPVCQVLANIDLEQPLEIQCYLNTKKSYQAHGRTVIPCNLSFKQNGDNIPWKFPWNAEEKTFDGLPDVGIKLGGVKDYTERNAVFEKEIEAFIERVKPYAEARKSNRPQTDAEKGSNIPDEDSGDDLPF